MRAAGWSGRRLALCLTISFLLSLAAAAHAQAPAPQVFRNEWVGKDPAGRTVRFVRWPIGSRDHVVELQIPTEYIEFAGGCGGFGSNQPDPNCRQPYSTEAPLLQAMLPDLVPVPYRPLTQDESRNVIHIKIESTFFGRDKTVAEDLQIQAKNRLDGFTSMASTVLGIRPWDQSRLVHKEPRFGLLRLGLSYDVPPRLPIRLEDFLFAPASAAVPDIHACEPFKRDPRWLPSSVRMCHDWVTSPDFMLCTDESVPSPDLEPGRYVPACEQWFGNEALSASVTLRYGRQHLRDWLDVKRRVLTLINTFNKGT